MRINKYRRIFTNKRSKLTRIKNSITSKKHKKNNKKTYIRSYLATLWSYHNKALQAFKTENGKRYFVGKGQTRVMLRVRFVDILSFLKKMLS